MITIFLEMHLVITLRFMERDMTRLCSTVFIVMDLKLTLHSAAPVLGAVHLQAVSAFIVM
jgi:hypothetical protein